LMTCSRSGEVIATPVPAHVSVVEKYKLPTAASVAAG
jgi:rRNA maturation protein Nop10